MILSGDLSHVLITSTRLTLRSFTAADSVESFAEVNDRIAQYMSWNPPSPEEHEAIVQWHIASMKAGGDLGMVLRLSTTNEFIGRASLEPADGTLLETGIWIKEAAQGIGYGREAIAALTRWASETFHPSGFLWPVVDENAPSRKLAEALRGEIIGTRQRQKPGDVARTLLLYCLPATTPEISN
jgi:RimJ/RimL family protein N-acetyltransferase